MPALSLLNMTKSFSRVALEQIPLTVWQRLFPKDVIALGYHIVSDEDLPHLKYYSYKDSGQFEADVAFMTERFRSVSYDEVAAHRLRRIALPPQSFLFTFDDGFAECYSVIRPILQRHGASGVFFVTTDFLNNRALFFETKVSLCLAAIEQMGTDDLKERAESLGIDAKVHHSGRRALAESRLSFARIARPTSPAHRALALWLLSLQQDDEAEIVAACAALGVDPDAYARRRPLYLDEKQVRRLAADGFIVGGHGLAHLPLQRMDRNRLENEVVMSCQIVRDLTGQEKVPFAFPYHGDGIDRGLLADLREHHPFVELIFDSGDLRRDASFVINRVWADPPPPPGSRRTNLPRSLRQSWSHRQAWFRTGLAERSTVEPPPPGSLTSERRHTENTVLHRPLPTLEPWSHLVYPRTVSSMARRFDDCLSRISS